MQFLRAMACLLNCWIIKNYNRLNISTVLSTIQTFPIRILFYDCHLTFLCSAVKPISSDKTLKNKKNKNAIEI